MIDPMARKRPSACKMSAEDRGDGLCNNCLWPVAEHATNPDTPLHDHTVGEKTESCPACQADPVTAQMAKMGEVAFKAAADFIEKMIPQDLDEDDGEYFLRVTSIIISAGEVMQTTFNAEIDRVNAEQQASSRSSV